MRRFAISTTFTAALALVAFAAPAHADRRAFANVYEYMTIPEGDVELEFYNTQSRSSFDPETARSFESQIELEYGITNRWDISLYQVFRQSSDPLVLENNSSLAYAKTKVRTRYRFSERGASPVDVLVYFELAKNAGSGSWDIEPKLVLARDFGKATVSLNIIPELKIEESVTVTGTDVESEREVEFEPAWALGVSYETSPKLKVGGEWFGEIEHPGDENEVAMWAGPSLSWAPSSKLWASANAGFGLTDESASMRFRFILGVGL